MSVDFDAWHHGVTSLDEVVVVSQALAATLPRELEEMRAEIAIAYEHRPRLAIQRGQAFPGLSEDYLRVVGTVGLDRISIGYLNRFEEPVRLLETPWSSGRDASDRRCVVCWYEADPVVVSYGNSSDLVEIVDHSTGDIRPLAGSFAELLVLASNIVAARLIGSGARGALEGIDAVLGADSPMRGLWEGFVRSAGLT